MIFFLGFAITGAHAQEAVQGAGGDALGTGGTFSYSIGQVVYITNTGINGTVAQGMQQPYVISTIVGIEVREINLQLSAYPNPTPNSLTLKIGNYANEKLTYHLYNMQGLLLDNGQVTSNNTSIAMESLSTSTYFLKISDSKKLVKAFRIIKK